MILIRFKKQQLIERRFLYSGSIADELMYLTMILKLCLNQGLHIAFPRKYV